MDSIEQLKAENDKLKERLNNAIKVFNEQKATIDSLNEKIDSLIVKNKRLNKNIDSLMQKNIKYTAPHKSPTLKRIGDNMIAGENIGI
jgi:uncharacterized coiled-coil DUF342 family protein